jgi:hypothetical protein
MSSQWSDLLSFRPPAYIQLAVKARSLFPGGWHFHRIEDASGLLNLDAYNVEISRMPLASSVVSFPSADPARRATDVELAYYVRTKLNMFVDSRLAGFEPYDMALDAPLWAAPLPIGAAIHIDMRDPVGVLPPSSNPDDGTVVVTQAAASTWLFSTVFSPLDGGHPVSGNREFGIRPGAVDGTFTFFTRGADRPTGTIDHVLQSKIFAMAHALWLSYQARITTFINQNGGQAVLGAVQSSRHDWNQAQLLFGYNPTGTWV